jgi:DNA-binding transcriptional ArsR family regulator
MSAKRGMPENRDAEPGMRGNDDQAGVPEAGPAPGMPGNPVRLTDPKMMRALAHPARIAIWEYLGLRGPATATQCAEVAGLSPSACSYHLRTLAKYGFVEEDRESAADGRERPWRVRLIAFSMEEPPDAPAAYRVANRLLVENLREAGEEVRVRYLDRKSEYPPEWQRASGETFSAAYVTPAELDEMRLKVTEVLEQYVRLDPAERSAGALPVQVMFDLFPWFGPEEARQQEHEEES